VEEHLIKIANDPHDRSASHWSHETHDWLVQMENLVRHVGDRSGAAWAARIETWQLRLARSSDVTKNEH
jgi:ADP-ribosylglycohydrolase